MPEKLGITYLRPNDSWRQSDEILGKTAGKHCGINRVVKKSEEKWRVDILISAYNTHMGHGTPYK